MRLRKRRSMLRFSTLNWTAHRNRYSCEMFNAIRSNRRCSISIFSALRRRRKFKKVPLHYLNQEISKAVKLGGAIITHVMTEIEIICLPAHLPEFIEVDLSELSAGQSLHIKDVSLPSHVELALYLSQENPVILSATVPSATEEAGAESATSEGNDTSAAA